MAKNINHSLDSFTSYLESMNCKHSLIYVSILINNDSKVSSTAFAAIIPTGIPEFFVVAYKFEHMDVPYIECTMHNFNDCKYIVNRLLKF